MKYNSQINAQRIEDGLGLLLCRIFSNELNGMRSSSKVNYCFKSRLIFLNLLKLL